MGELRAVEPFCGAGGMALGLADAGFAHAWAGEMDKHAAATFRAMFPGVPVFEGKVETGAEAGDAGAGIDLLAGGPPCQGFSSAGLGRGEYDARDGFPAFLRMVRTLRPRAFLIENVKGLTTSKHADYFTRVLADLRAAGYAVGWRVLDAADYGVPQRRHRVFVVGIRRDVGLRAAAAGIRFAWPAPTHSIEALVVAKWVGGSYWAAHGMNGPPLNATRSRDEERVLKKLQAKDAVTIERAKLRRWRTVRDAIGDIAWMVKPGRTMHSAPVEEQDDSQRLTTTTPRNVSASGRQTGSDLPCDTVQSAHQGHNGHPPIVGLELRGHDPVPPPKPSESTPEWLKKHPAAAADSPSPAVRTGHRDAGTLVTDQAELLAPVQPHRSAQVGERLAGRLLAGRGIGHAARNAVLNSRAAPRAPALAGECAEADAGDFECLEEDAAGIGGDEAVSHGSNDTREGGPSQHAPRPLSPGELGYMLRDPRHLKKHAAATADSPAPTQNANNARGVPYGLVDEQDFKDDLFGLPTTDPRIRNIDERDFDPNNAQSNAKITVLRGGSQAKRESIHSGLYFEGVGRSSSKDSPAHAVPASAGGNKTPIVGDYAQEGDTVDAFAETGEDGKVTMHPPTNPKGKAITLRRLTVREVARLQDFPDAHIFSGPKTAQYRQVGNACPRGLARPVAQAIADLLHAVDALS